MSALALLLLALLLALLALTATLAFSRACVYATLLGELDASSAPRRTRAPRARAGRTSIAHGRNLPESRTLGLGRGCEFGHEPC